VKAALSSSINVAALFSNRRFVIALAVSFVGVSYVIGTEPPGVLQQMMAASVSGRSLR
jgi:hypothetical protein